VNINIMYLPIIIIIGLSGMFIVILGIEEILGGLREGDQDQDK